MIFQPAPESSRALLSEDAYQQIKDALNNFLLIPGDRFTESQLSEQLNVSRTPIRQALFRLQQEGFVEVLFRNGWRVLPLDFGHFDALYDFRILIETDAIHGYAMAVPPAACPKVIPDFKR